MGTDKEGGPLGSPLPASAFGALSAVSLCSPFVRPPVRKPRREALRGKGQKSFDRYPPRPLLIDTVPHAVLLQLPQMLKSQKLDCPCIWTGAKVPSAI